MTEFFESIPSCSKERRVIKSPPCTNLNTIDGDEEDPLIDIKTTLYERERRT